MEWDILNSCSHPMSVLEGDQFKVVGAKPNAPRERKKKPDAHAKLKRQQC